MNGKIYTMINLTVFNNETELSIAAANLVIQQIKANPQSVMVFPTGNTPLGMFEQLVSNYQKGFVSFKDSCLIELDEYFGISLDAPLNLFSWLDRTLIQKVDFKPENVYRFNSNASDPAKEIARIDRVLSEKNGIDLLVLGLGPNGHIGFNEPGSQVNSPTRIIELSKASLLSNARYWGEESIVPKKGITLGMNHLLKAKKVILLVQGTAKAAILEATVNSPISEKIPATYLRELGQFHILADLDAASLLK